MFLVGKNAHCENKIYLAELYRCLSGKLWYLQHQCVGDTIVYHWASDIFFAMSLQGFRNTTPFTDLPIDDSVDDGADLHTDLPAYVHEVVHTETAEDTCHQQYDGQEHALPGTDITSFNIPDQEAATAHTHDWHGYFRIVDLCARSRHQWERQVNTPQSNYAIWLLAPTLNTCFWHTSHLWGVIICFYCTLRRRAVGVTAMWSLVAPCRCDNLWCRRVVIVTPPPV